MDKKTEHVVNIYHRISERETVLKSGEDRWLVSAEVYDSVNFRLRGRGDIIDVIKE